VAELASLLEPSELRVGERATFIHPIFNLSAPCWTSEPSAEGPNRIWYVNFRYGAIQENAATFSNCAMAVRSE
jgi:hypothetical protein